MVLRSYDYFKSQGDWSRYLTIKDAMSGDPGVFLGSVATFDLLPATVSAAKVLWSLGSYDPKISDTAFVDTDDAHGDDPSQYVINQIDNDNITWKFQFSIPVPTGIYELIANKATDFGTVNDTLYPSVKAVDDLFKSFHGIVAGGTTGQSLVKKSNADYDVEWVTGGSGGQPTDITSDDFVIGGSDYSRSVNIKTGGLVTSQFADVSITTGKLADDAVTNDKLADNSVGTSNISDNAVITSKILDKNITLPKIAVGSEGQIIKTVDGEAVWDTEGDISNKADKFLYTPAEGTETLYNLDSIKSFNVMGNGGGSNPNSGIVWTNFAGEQVSIDIDGLPGFFNYKGQVKTYERLPSFSDPSLANGDLYSIYGPLNNLGSVATSADLPTTASDLDEVYIEDTEKYVYWSQPDSGQSGEWIYNHCQQLGGCDNTGWYVFGVGEPNVHWNRLDSELTVDQVLDVNSINAIANKPVAQALLNKLNILSPDTLSEFFNDNDGGGLCYYDSSHREVAGITLNTVNPQLYLNRYDGSGTLTNKVLFEIHDDGAYISTVLDGTSWVKIATKADIDALFQDYTVSTNYIKNSFLRKNTVDSSTYNRYGIVVDNYESVDFDTDITAGHIDELSSMKELNDTLDYCLTNYFPSSGE
jgi:hypothetical protein